jgi:arylsulfatase A-like enzyme
MSGRRPDATKTWNFLDHFREEGVGANWTALPEHFKNNGYLTTGCGKLFHPGVPPNYVRNSCWQGLLLYEYTR